MHNCLQYKLYNSLQKSEQRDFEIINEIIHGYITNKEKNIVILSDDPYLFVLTFLSLTLVENVNIHLLNPKEGLNEIQRLLFSINPDAIIIACSEGKWRSLTGYYKIFISDELRTSCTFTESYNPDILDQIEEMSEEGGNYKVTTYSPYPTKINSISSSTLELFVGSMETDLVNFSLLSVPKNNGLMPFVSDSIDYLLYFIAFKITNPFLVLPSSKEYNWPIESKKQFFNLNKADTLIFSKHEFIKLWEKEVITLLENNFVFNLYPRFQWLINLLIQRRLKRLLKGYSKLLIIGALNNSYMIQILKNCSFLKVFSVIPIETALMYGQVSKDLDMIILTENSYRKDVFIQETSSVDRKLYKRQIRLSDPNSMETMSIIVDSKNYFKQVGYWVKEQFFVKYQFIGEGVISSDHNRKIFPETLERVINSYPFIRYSAIITFEGKNHLIVIPYENILDSVKINYGEFVTIIKNQIVKINELLPEDYKIENHLISLDILKRNRLDEIYKFDLI